LRFTSGFDVFMMSASLFLIRPHHYFW